MFGFLLTNKCSGNIIISERAFDFRQLKRGAPSADQKHDPVKLSDGVSGNRPEDKAGSYKTGGIRMDYRSKTHTDVRKPENSGKYAETSLRYRKHAVHRASLRRRKRLIHRIRRMLPAACLIFAMMTALIILSGFSRPQIQTIHPARCYRIITVDPNDTLWEIAEKNLSVQEQPIRRYIREIMEVNGLVSSRIYAGQRLAIPYNPELAAREETKAEKTRALPKGALFS